MPYQQQLYEQDILQFDPQVPPAVNPFQPGHLETPLLTGPIGPVQDNSFQIMPLEMPALSGPIGPVQDNTY